MQNSTSSASIRICSALGFSTGFIRRCALPQSLPTWYPFAVFSPLSNVNFFFRAVDGIRDGRVTGVQTCALPIYLDPPRLARRRAESQLDVGRRRIGRDRYRSEERRVGKECRYRWSTNN